MDITKCRWDIANSDSDDGQRHTTDHATIVQYTDYVQKQCIPIKIRAACLAAAVILAAFAAYINIAMLCCGCCSPSCAVGVTISTTGNDKGMGERARKRKREHTKARENLLLHYHHLISFDA